MIPIFRCACMGDPEINFFHDRTAVAPNEVVVKTKEKGDKVYTYAEPAEPGNYAFGGTILFTTNGVFPEFNTPIKLHDRQMNLEDRGMGI